MVPTQQTFTSTEDFCPIFHLILLVEFTFMDWFHCSPLKNVGWNSTRIICLDGWSPCTLLDGYLCMRLKITHPKLLQKSDNKLVCIGIPSGNPWQEQFHQFGASGAFKDYVNPVRSPTIVKMYSTDMVEFCPANAIPHFLAYAPPLPNVVPFLTAEQKREHKQW